MAVNWKIPAVIIYDLDNGFRLASVLFLYAFLHHFCSSHTCINTPSMHARNTPDEGPVRAEMQCVSL